MPLILDTGPFLLGALLRLHGRIPGVEADIARLGPRHEAWDAQYRSAYEGLILSDRRSIPIIISSWVLGETPRTIMSVFGWKPGDRKWRLFWSHVREDFLDRCDVRSIDLDRFFETSYRELFLEYGPADVSSLIISRDVSGPGVIFTHDSKLATRAYAAGVMAGDLDTVVPFLGRGR